LVTFLQLPVLTYRNIKKQLQKIPGTYNIFSLLLYPLLSINTSNTSLQSSHNKRWRWREGEERPGKMSTKSKNKKYVDLSIATVPCENVSWPNPPHILQP
jgi:hypothetical protein